MERDRSFAAVTMKKSSCRALSFASRRRGSGPVRTPASRPAGQRSRQASWSTRATATRRRGTSRGFLVGAARGQRVVLSRRGAGSPELVSLPAALHGGGLRRSGPGLRRTVLGDGRARSLRHSAREQLWANARDSALGFYLATGWTVVEGSEHVSPETRICLTRSSSKTFAAR